MTTRVEEPIGSAKQRSPRLQWRRSVQEFLWLPLLITAGLLIFGALTVVFESVTPAVLQPANSWLAQYIAAQTAVTMLSTIAGGLVTLTSITFSVLLLAVFQTATAYSGVVIDQFLRRRSNQVYFGFFVGVSVYAFLTLAFADPSGNPALGAVLGLALTLAALVMLLVLIYRTIDQMRPGSVVLAIRDLALDARREQAELLARTRPTARLPGERDVLPVTTVHKGYIVRIDVRALEGVLTSMPREMEIVFHTRVGHHIAFGDVLCDVRGGEEEDRQRLAVAVLDTITLENIPNIRVDPGYAADQLSNVAWTTGSSSQQNPEASMAAITTMRDLVSRWTAAGLPDAEDYGGALPIAYSDGIVAQLLGRLASLLAGASAAGQHQTVAHILNAYAIMLPRLVPTDQAYAFDAIQLGLPAAARQVRTLEIHRALQELQESVRGQGRPDVEGSIDELAASLSGFR